MYARILLPTDGSRGTGRVADHAIDLATRYEASLDALHALERGAPDASSPAGDGTESGEASVETLVTRAEDAGIEARGFTRDGRPSRAILDHVEDADIDLIVMGTHGRSGVDRLLLGSVTERVVRLAPVPVMTVGLSGRDRRVPDRATAIELARDALRRTDHELGAVSDVYEGIGTWVVVAETDDGTRVNVHIDATTRETRIATLDG